MKNSFLTKILPVLLLAIGICFGLETPAMACTGPDNIFEFGLLMIFSFPIPSSIVGMAALWMIVKVTLSFRD